MVPVNRVVLCCVLLLLSSCSAAQNYIVHVQQGTGDWGFVSFYPLRLTVRTNDTVTFRQDFDYGLVALTPSGVSLAATTTLAADPEYPLITFVFLTSLQFHIL